MKLGSSLHAPFVQELVIKEPLSQIPSRYVFNDIYNEGLPDRNSSLQVPVINLETLLSGDDLELQKMDRACKDWGVFQLINHGVDPSLVEEMKSGVEGFFNLPIEEKSKLLRKPDDVEGYGQIFVQSEEQKLDWGDRFHMGIFPAYLRKPHLFSNLPPQFRETIVAYAAELKNVAMKLLLSMAKALGIKEEEMRNLFNEGWQYTRMNYYPQCPQPELAVGLRAHSDDCALTILLQVNEMDGLQVKKDGMWIPIRPLPNAFIVNIGDILEIVTNGQYHSIIHRATVNLEKERLSVGIFLNPKLDGDMGPAQSLLSPESPPLYKTLPVEEFLKIFYAHKLVGRSQLDRMRINYESTCSKE